MAWNVAPVVRNTIAIVRSIVCRTVADGETSEDYQGRLSSRLASFARLQSHLLRNPTTGVDLCLLIADELLPFGIRLEAVSKQRRNECGRSGSGLIPEGCET